MQLDEAEMAKNSRQRLSQELCTVDRLAIEGLELVMEGDNVLTRRQVRGRQKLGHLAQEDGDGVQRPHCFEPVRRSVVVHSE